MTNQQSIPSQGHEPVCEHKGFRVYRTKTGFEAFKSGRKHRVGTRIDKHTGEEKDVLAANKIERVVLPGETIEEALAGLDRYLTKPAYIKPQPPPALF